MKESLAYAVVPRSNRPAGMRSGKGILSATGLLASQIADANSTRI